MPSRRSRRSFPSRAAPWWSTPIAPRRTRWKASAAAPNARSARSCWSRSSSRSPASSAARPRSAGRFAAFALAQSASRERADEGVLVEAEADTTLCLEPADVVHHAVLTERRDLVVLLLEALHDERSLVHAVAPVGVHAVAG